MASRLAFLKHVPIVGPLLASVHARLTRPAFHGSQPYWEQRYQAGDNSGAGSYGRLAEYKAAFLNRFVAEHGITRVLEFGCGDGNQLSLAQYPEYIGLDVSAKAIQLCRQRFAADTRKSFFLYDGQAFADRTGVFRSDLVLSLDVIYHLVEDAVFHTYLDHVFGSASRYVILYTSNHDAPAFLHVRHRQVTRAVAERFPDWQLVQAEANPYPWDEANPTETSFANFYVFTRPAA